MSIYQYQKKRSVIFEYIQSKTWSKMTDQMPDSLAQEQMKFMACQCVFGVKLIRVPRDDCQHICNILKISRSLTLIRVCQAFLKFHSIFLPFILGWKLVILWLEDNKIYIHLSAQSYAHSGQIVLSGSSWTGNWADIL